MLDLKTLLPRVKTTLEEWLKIYGNVSAMNLVFKATVIDSKMGNYNTTNMVSFRPLDTGNQIMWMAAARFAGWTVFHVGADVV